MKRRVASGICDLRIRAWKRYIGDADMIMLLGGKSWLKRQADKDGVCYV
jgi:hypothetical protein